MEQHRIIAGLAAIVIGIGVASVANAASTARHATAAASATTRHASANENSRDEQGEEKSEVVIALDKTPAAVQSAIAQIANPKIISQEEIINPKPGNKILALPKIRL